MIIAGTGHRPDRLGGYGPEVDQWLHTLCVRELMALKPETVISGMAVGFDQALASAAIHLDIPFLAYIPFEGQESKWPESSKKRYFDLLSKAKGILYCSPPGYAVWKMHKRNHQMVDDCDKVLALWNGNPFGGTFECVTYAQSKNRAVENCWKRWELLINSV